MRLDAPLTSHIPPFAHLLLPRRRDCSRSTPPLSSSPHAVGERRGYLARDGRDSGSSIREIAKHLDRAASTVSREITRYGGRPAYRAHEADEPSLGVGLAAQEVAFLPCTRRLREVVTSKLILEWSPEQVSGWLKTEYPNDERMRVSHETIYRSLFIQARGVLKRELMDHLRTKRRMTQLAALSYLQRLRAVKSQMPSRLGKDRLKLRTALSRVIGKAIC